VTGENLDRARVLYAAWNRHDLDGILEHIPQGFEFHLHGKPVGLPDVIRGQEGVRRLFEDWFDGPWGEMTMDFERVEEVADERVLALFTFRASGRSSGAEVSVPYAHILTYRDGLLIRMDGYASRKHALREAGLRD
jgi:ketosteroid isomerase-like protein